MKERKTSEISIRLTDSERRTIKECASDSMMTQAEYVRSKALGREVKYRPRGLVVLLKHLLKINIEISREINQMARERRMQGVFAASDYLELIQYLEKLNQNYEKLSDQVMEVAMEAGID